MEYVNTFTRFLYEAFNVSYVLLAVLLYVGVHIGRQAPRADNYWAGIFRDDAGKVSALRVAALGAFAVHSAVLLYLTTTVMSMQQVAVKDAMDALWSHVIVYAITWSGAPVAAKFLEVLAPRFAK
jgi:hypothetical protein